MESIVYNIYIYIILLMTGHPVFRCRCDGTRSGFKPHVLYSVPILGGINKGPSCSFFGVCLTRKPEAASMGPKSRCVARKLVGGRWLQHCQAEHFAAQIPQQVGNAGILRVPQRGEQFLVGSGGPPAKTPQSAQSDGRLRGDLHATC